ncbi:uncharacterized protein DSM5745_01809 [Aspergillus mulundensis]|uniref:Serine/threonine-protein kinase ATG1 n=1 Tax=Aspergillus mulundensis TaxID=1810919 RepID=A0A3D8SUT9_9EURO|nr:hypothetical protein DSM5745_01809 [Aspergillus mulundensis]RDW90034.1 hypothetical protein DSM5745_01809 [Aspergillus mulundensis]
MAFSFQSGDHLMKDIRKELQRAMQNRYDANKKFLPRSSLEGIWLLDRLKKMAQHYRAFNLADIPIIRAQFMQTISILIYIRWNQWDNFRLIFLEYPHRSDGNLLTHDYQTLSDESFLGSWGQKFLDKRYLFCPVDIVEGTITQYTQRHRLPFLDSHFKDAKRAYTAPISGTGFSARAIATEHLHLQPNRGCHRGTYIILCKTNRNQSAFLKEKENLRLLRDVSLQHDRIMPYLAIITTGDVSNILYELPDMDLGMLLSEQSKDVPLHDLVSESCKLASALQYLHQERGGSKSANICCHMDLKPSNILVFKSCYNRAGKWKISGFGFSTISPAHLDGDHFPPPDGITLRGTYQSPEIFHGNIVGRKTDVWSLGCILVRVLAFGLDGARGLKYLDYRRRLLDDGKSYYEHDAFHRGNPPELNPRIESWVKDIPGKANSRMPWGTCLIFHDILLRALDVDPVSRSTAQEIYHELRNILRILATPTPSDNLSLTDMESDSLHGPSHTTENINDDTSWPYSTDQQLKEAEKRCHPSLYFGPIWERDTIMPDLRPRHAAAEGLNFQENILREEYHGFLKAIQENLEDPNPRVEYHSVLRTIQDEEDNTDKHYSDDTIESPATETSAKVSLKATEWSFEFCLVCDRQTLGAPYCCQSCRLADLEVSHGTPASLPQSSVFDTRSGGAYTSTATTSQAQTNAERRLPTSNALQVSEPILQDNLSSRSESSSPAPTSEVRLEPELELNTLLPEDAVDAETTFSTGSGVDDRQRRYIRVFIDRLAHDIKHVSKLSTLSEVPSSYLGSLLKVFSWKLHAESINPFQWEASVILRQKQTEILDLLILEPQETENEHSIGLESVSSQEGQEGYSGLSEHRTFTKPPDILSNWISNLEVPVSSPGEQPSAGFSPSQEDLTGDLTTGRASARDEHFSQLPDYERFICASDAYQWLLLKIHQHGNVTLNDPSVVSNIGKTLRNRLRAQKGLHRISRRKASLVSMTFTVDWSPVQYFKDLGVDIPAPNVLESVLCLTGTWNEAQATTAVEYLRQTWPISGQHLIALMHQLIELPEGKELYYHLPGPKGAEVRAQIQPTGTCCVSVIGSPYFVAELGEQIGWLASALQVPQGYMQGVVACSPDITDLVVSEDNRDHSVVAVGSCRLVLGFMEKPKIQSAAHGFCWGPLFSNQTLVSGYPILQRQAANTGLEMSLNLMTALIRTKQVVQWGERVIMKGFSWLAIATFCTSGTTLWHLLTSASAHERISYIDPRLDTMGIQESEKTLLRSLEGSRHIVGWCSNAIEYCGHAAALQNISASGLPIPPPSIVIDRLYLEGGAHLVGGFNMCINKKERPFWLQRESDYPSLIKWISLQPIVFYDTSECRAWLVDGVSALLHLVRISLNLDESDPESPYDWVSEPSRLKDTWNGSCTGRLTALKTLTCWDNLKLPVYVKDCIDRGNQPPELHFSTLGDRIQKILHSLEILLDRQVKAASQDGIKISQTLNTHRGIVGFDILDVINPLGPIQTRMKILPSHTHGWIDFVQSTGVTTIFGSGFGDLIRPTDPDAVCARWKSVPMGMDYLATSVSTLNMLHEKRLQRLEPGLGLGEMTNKILWISPENQPFKTCECLCGPASAALDARCHLHPVQYLVSKKPWKPNILPRGSAPVNLMKLEKKGAVVFGHLSALGRWREHAAEAGEAAPTAGTSTDALPAPVPRSHRPTTEVVVFGMHIYGVDGDYAAESGIGIV